MWYLTSKNQANNCVGLPPLPIFLKFMHRTRSLTISLQSAITIWIRTVCLFDESFWIQEKWLIWLIARNNWRRHMSIAIWQHQFRYKDIRGAYFQIDLNEINRLSYRRGGRSQSTKMWFRVSTSRGRPTERKNRRSQ